MRKLIIALAMMLAMPAMAADIPVDSTRLDVTGSDVNLNFRIAGAAAPAPDVKILFCECSEGKEGIDENSIIQNWSLWAYSSPDGKTTIKKMVQEGWKISQILSATMSNKQFYIVFTK